MHFRISRLWLIAPLSDGLEANGVEAYPYKCPTYPTVNIRIPPEDVGDAIDWEFNDLFDQWRKLTSETLSEVLERSEIDCSFMDTPVSSSFR